MVGRKFLAFAELTAPVLKFFAVLVLAVRTDNFSASALADP